VYIPDEPGILVPVEVLLDILDSVDPKESDKWPVYEVPCDTKFNFYLEINGFILIIDETTGVMQVEDTCLLAFQWNDFGVDFWLGKGFLVKIVVLFMNLKIREIHIFSCVYKFMGFVKFEDLGDMKFKTT
jgi:hypothetical protein